MRRQRAVQAREVVLITGISGSGKSVALHALEDAGFYCIDNLPPELLREFLRLEGGRTQRRVAIAVDARSAGSLPHLLPLLEELRGEGVLVRSVFLDASTDALVRRFSETRRLHPLSSEAARGKVARPGTHHDFHRALTDAIELERELLAELREVSVVVDTSQLRPAQLRAVGARPGARRRTSPPRSCSSRSRSSMACRSTPTMCSTCACCPTLTTSASCARKPDATRKWSPTSRRSPKSARLLSDIEAFLRRWLPAFAGDPRSYLTVAIGCTGGQHRSVYFVEVLAKRFADHPGTLIRHRELDARDG